MKTTTDAERAEHKNIWVVAEIVDGEIKEVTLELLGAGRSLADARGSELWCISLAEIGDEKLSPLFHYSADKVVVVDSIDSTHFIDEDYSETLAKLVRDHKPEVVLFPATSRGRAVAPRVAVDLHTGLIADGNALEIDSGGELRVTRAVFGGSAVATVKSSDHRPQMTTIRPRVMSPVEPDTARTGEILRDEGKTGGVGANKAIQSVTPGDSESIQISDADFIVTGGRGMKGPEGFDLLKKLANRVGGAVGASRAAVDSGWIPYDHQVGQTGQTVKPRVYIACGISGQIQHLVGMRSSDFIVAINKDPDAPIMEIADVAVVGDLFEIIPELIEELGKT